MQIDTSVHDTCVLFVIYTVRHHLLQLSFIRTFHDPEYITSGHLPSHLLYINV